MDLVSAGAAYLAAVQSQNLALEAFRAARQAISDAEAALARAVSDGAALEAAYRSAKATSASALLDLEAAALGGVVVESDPGTLSPLPGAGSGSVPFGPLAGSGLVENSFPV